MFNEFEPLPDPYWVGAMVCRTLCMVNMAKGSRPPEIEDFLPWLGPDRRQTDEEMRAAFLAATSHLGGE